MINLQSLEDLSLLRESISLECKLANGRDGKGTLPDDFWPTYSAMANADGGVVILGLRERQGRFEPVGIENPDKVRTELFNNLNNRQKVSVNLLTDNEVRDWAVEGKTLLMVAIPRASRQQRPVYLTTNPLNGNTYRRLNEGDRALPDEDVKRMLAEQVEDSRDSRILPHFGLKDLDADSLKAYRNIFRADKPDHPWLTLDDEGFLRMLGGWREDRATGDAGLTVAGLLMFGQWTSISEALPHYFLDYQERPADYASSVQWLDRVVPDGNWSGNVFDFYRRVVNKLTADLKVPFVLKDGVRQDDTPTHKALREALVNTLVHADFTGRMSVLVVKEPAGFSFRNPGGLRVPAALALLGGLSDCRNRTMQQMFLMIGLGERAGSGMSRILHGWQDLGHGVRLLERYEPQEHSVLEMTWRDELVPKGSPESSPESSPQNSLKTEERVLQLLRDTPSMTTQALGERLGISKRGVLKQVEKLKEQGRLRRVGPNKGGHWEVLEP
jgi:ATP-dependent DNA helicase RecG